PCRFTALCVGVLARPARRVLMIAPGAYSKIKDLPTGTAMTDRLLVIFAALTLMVGVGTGAFGAHALKRILSPDTLAIWQTAVQYQMVHGLGMLLIALLATRYGSPLLHYAGMLMF